MCFVALRGHVQFSEMHHLLFNSVVFIYVVNLMFAGSSRAINNFETRGKFFLVLF